MASAGVPYVSIISRSAGPLCVNLTPRRRSRRKNRGCLFSQFIFFNRVEKDFIVKVFILSGEKYGKIFQERR